LLIGEYEHNIDQKGRLNFPAKLRDSLGERFFITKGQDKCLFAYSAKEWEALELKLRALPMSKSRELLWHFFAGATEVEPDKQGRVVIPSNLRDHAGLSKDVMIVGVSLRAEIWDKHRWIEKCSAITSETITAAIDELGI